MEDETEEIEELDELDQIIIKAIKKEAIKDILRKSEKKIQRRKKIFKITKVVLLSIAAVAVVGLFIVNKINTDNQAILNKNIAEEYKAKIELATRSGSQPTDTIQNRLEAIIAELHNGDDQKTISMAESLINDLPPAPEYNNVKYCLQYFIALCYVSLNDVDKAIAILQDIQDKPFMHKLDTQSLLKELSE